MYWYANVTHTHITHTHTHTQTAGLDLDQLRQLYFEMKETVFKNPKFGYACDTPALEALLKKTLGTEMRMCDKQEPRYILYS